LKKKTDASEPAGNDPKTPGTTGNPNNPGNTSTTGSGKGGDSGKGSPATGRASAIGIVTLCVLACGTLCLTCKKHK